MGVEESKAGTIPTVEGQAKAPPAAKGGTPESASKVSPEETQKLYTQKEADALVHVAKSEAGREKKVLEDVVVNLKAQIQTKESDIEENATDIEKLQTKVEDLASNDPERFNAIKELRVARDERRQLKADRSALEDEKREHGETVKLAQSTLREITVFEVAAEYESGDAVKLKELCETFEAKSDEQIRKIADTLWTKKAAESLKPATPPLKPYSGITEGGGLDFSKLTPDEKIKESLRRIRKQ